VAQAKPRLDRKRQALDGVARTCGPKSRLGSIGARSKIKCAFWTRVFELLLEAPFAHSGAALEEPAREGALRGTLPAFDADYDSNKRKPAESFGTHDPSARLSARFCCAGYAEKDGLPYGCARH
jgi:hypothetical protein